MIKIPLKLDLTKTSNAAYLKDLSFQQSLVLQFFNIDAIIQKFFILPDGLWKKEGYPYLILKGTENSDKGAYLVTADFATDTNAYFLKIVYCSDLNNISSNNLIDVGPLVTFYNSNYTNKIETDHLGGDPCLCIIPINRSCTVLIFAFNDLQYPCSMIVLYNENNENYVNIVTNGSYNNNSTWLPYNFNGPGSNTDLVHSIELYNTLTGRTYFTSQLGTVAPVPVLQRVNLNKLSVRKYFQLLIGQQFIPDIWVCDGGQAFSIFLRECTIDDIEYFTMWENVLIKNNNVDSIILDDDTLSKRDFVNNPLEVFLCSTTIEEQANGVHFIIKNTGSKEVKINVYKNGEKITEWLLRHLGERLPHITVNDTIDFSGVLSLVGDNSHIVKGVAGDKIVLTYTIDDVNIPKDIATLYINNNFREANIKLTNGADKLIAKFQLNDVGLAGQEYCKKNNNDTVYYCSCFIEGSQVHQFLLIGKTQNSVKVNTVLKNSNQEEVSSVSINERYLSIYKSEEQIFKILYNNEIYYCNFVVFSGETYRNEYQPLVCEYQSYQGQNGNVSRQLSKNYNLTLKDEEYLLPSVDIIVDQSETFSLDFYKAKLPMMWIFSKGVFEEMGEYNKDNCYFSPEAIINLIENINEWEEGV